MLFAFIVVITMLALINAGVPTESKVSASLKDTSVNGIEGLNVNLVAPFKFQDYIVGFKYALGDITKVPESLFAKRSFDAGDESKLTIEADYSISESTLAMDTKWASKKLDLTLSASGDNKNKLTKVEALKDLLIDEGKLTLKAVYNLPKKVISGYARYKLDKTELNVDYDSASQDPVLSVTRALDDNNDLTPSISLKSGALAYAWKRKWTGGSLESKLTPGEKVDVEWKDEGANGLWTTSAEFPLEDAAKCKVSIVREWKY